MALGTERNVIMVRGGKRLKDVLPQISTSDSPPDGAFTKDADKWERFRPIVARVPSAGARSTRLDFPRGWIWARRAHAREEARRAASRK